MNISLIFFHCHFFLFLEMHYEGEKGGTTTALIALSVMSAILCLSIVGCFVYHRRRVSGARTESLILELHNVS